jgi:hypothetical protein
MIEILTASKEHSEDAVRAGLAESRPGFRIETMELVGDEWNIRISDEGGFPFKKKDDDDSGESSSEKSESDSDDKKEDSDDSDGEKKDSDDGDSNKKDDNASVEKLRSLVEELQQKVEEVVQNAAEVAEDADGKQQKMEEIHDSVKEHVKGDGDGEKSEGLPGEDAPAAPLPEDGVGLEDIGPTPGAPPKGGPKPPMPPAPGAKKRPPMTPGVSTFGRAVVANHPGVNDQGERIELLAAALQIADDPEFAELELVGMVKNRDGSFSAKLQPRNAS